MHCFNPVVYSESNRISMSGNSGNKINQQLLTAPVGAVLTTAWLEDRGISSGLANYYVSSGWLHRVGTGAFTTTSEPPTWLGAVFGLQQKAGCTIHPGGRTALDILGKGHFLSLGKQAVYLFGDKGERLPAWFQNLSLPNKLHYVGSHFLPPDVGLQEYRPGTFTLKVSSVERAVLELLYEQKIDEAGYEHTRLIFESLGTLRGALVQQLLECCSSVKVKRLFLHLAEPYQHPWLKELDLKKISLGSGKRVLFKGGKLDKKYLITVPATDEIASDAP